MNKLAKRIFITGVVAVATLTMSTGILADTKTNDVDVTIKSGGSELSVPSIESFGEVSLDDKAETYKTSFVGTFNVQDLTGTQDGWKVQVSADKFTNGNHELPSGSLVMNALDTIERVGTGSGHMPTISMENSKVIDDGTVEVAKATTGGGMGVFDLTFSDDALSLIIDATTAKVGVYASTLHWDLVQAP